jgi:outer membrane receptor for ferrienterochelin and colicin
MATKFIPIILSLFFTLNLNLIWAQAADGKISGCVRDEQGKPVPDVYVTLSPLNLMDITDRDGIFIIENILPGVYSIQFSHINFYKKIVNNIKVRAAGYAQIDTIVLKQQILSADATVITATRTEHNIYDVSTPINLVNDRIIKERNAKTSAEALREENGIFIQKTNHGGGSAIIRGLSSNQILILVDGIRLNNSIYRLGNHQYLTTVDNNNVRQIEVARGPSSSLYGSDALGGVINLLTKMPDLETTELSCHYSLLSRFASADQEKTARGEFSLHSKKIALQTGFSYKDYGDLKRGKNSDYRRIENSTNGLKQSPTGFKAYDFDSKLLYGLTPRQTLIFACQISKQTDVPRYDKYENNGYNRWIYQPQNRNLIYLVYENNLGSKYINTFQAAVSLHRQEEGREIQKADTSALIREKDDVKTIGVTFQVNSNFARNLITFGGEFYTDDVHSERFIVDTKSGKSEKDLSGRYPDGAVYNSLGLYIHDEIFLAQKLTATTGARFSYAHTNFLLPDDSTMNVRFGDITQNFQSITGSFGCIYKLNDQVQLNLNIGQAFRAPNLSDLSKFGESKGETYEVPNPNLKPEKMISFDIGFKINYSRFKANASIYYSKISGLIASAPATYNGSPVINGYKVKTKKNIGNAYISGFEFSTDYNFYKALTFRSNLAITYGQNTSKDEPVGGIPPIFGLTGLKWNSDLYYVDFYIRFAGKQNRLSADDEDDPRIPKGGTPGWQTFNIRTGTQLNKWLNLQFAVENIFDYNYREHGSGLNGSGINFIVGLSIKK